MRKALEQVGVIEEAHGKDSAFDDVSVMADAGSDIEPATVSVLARALTDARVATCDGSNPTGQGEPKPKEACPDPCWLCVEHARLSCWQSCHYPLELPHSIDAPGRRVDASYDDPRRGVFEIVRTRKASHTPCPWTAEVVVIRIVLP